MNTTFETSFVIFPEHTNALSPLIFGGAFFAQMDLCAARCVNRFLYESKVCDSAVTYRFEGMFHKPCYLGDLIFLTAEIVEVREKAIVVTVQADRERKDGRDQIANCKFVFVSVQNDIQKLVETKPEMLPYKFHGLKLEKIKTKMVDSV